MMRRKVPVILMIFAGMLVFATILLVSMFPGDSETKQRKNEIEQRSGREIRASSLPNMYYQAVRKGDDMEFVHKVIINQSRVKTGVTTKKGASYKFEEYAFDEGAATVYLYVEYDESGKVRYIALQ